jgi:hypothetical protein
LEDAILKERGERFEHGGRCRRIALARVHPEQPAFIVIEVQKIEADAAVADPLMPSPAYSRSTTALQRVSAPPI